MKAVSMNPVRNVDTNRISNDNNLQNINETTSLEQYNSLSTNNITYSVNTPNVSNRAETDSKHI